MIELDSDRMRVRKGSKWMKVTLSQMAILQTLLSDPAQVFTRDQLLIAIGGRSHMPTTRVVDNQILRLRKLLGKRVIETIHGVGYAWRVR